MADEDIDFWVHYGDYVYVHDSATLTLAAGPGDDAGHMGRARRPAPAPAAPRGAFRRSAAGRARPGAERTVCSRI